MMCQEDNTKTKRCGKYSFRLIGKPKNYFKDTTVIDFKPIQKTKKIEKFSILPTFNKDKKYYTPAFIIPSLPQQRDEVLIEQHQRRKLQNTQQMTSIYVPKPRSRQKYCGVCRQYYEEYLQHTMGSKHIQKLQNSPFQKYILQQCQKFKQKFVEGQPQIQKINSSQISNDTILPQNEGQIIDVYLNFN